MEPMIQLQNLKKNYGKKEAVKGISLDIFPGELFVLVGPNGAGKTSTLKMMCGLLKPTAGSVKIAGHDMAREPQKAKQQLSFVPDIPYVYDKLTPWELLRFVGKLYSMDPGTIQARGKELLQQFELAHVENVLIEEFSHGMKQKAILASALVHAPKVFILDEPMVGLDPMSIMHFKNLLRQKTKEGMTVIFSTHTLPLAEELADRIGVIGRGELIALGTIADLKKKYASQENLEKMFVNLIEQKG